MKTVYCPLCKGTAKFLVHGIIEGPHLDVFICEKCIVAFQVPMPILQQVKDYYSGPYYKIHVHRVKSPEEAYDKKLDLLRVQRILFGNFMPKGSSVLDVGCSAGGYMRMLRDEYDCDVEGIEPDPDYRAYAQREGFIVYPGYIEEFEHCKNKQYDAITFNQVFEHMVDPWTILRKVMTLLKPGGKVFLEVPHLADARIFLLKHDSLRFCFQKAHLWYYSVGALNRIVHECGFINTEYAPLQFRSFCQHLSLVITSWYRKMVGAELTEEIINKYFTTPMDLPMFPEIKEKLDILSEEYVKELVKRHLFDTFLLVGTKP